MAIFMKLFKKKKPMRICRSCNKKKETMAITYGEKEGLCRACLDDVLPLALKPRKR